MVEKKKTVQEKSVKELLKKLKFQTDLLTFAKCVKKYKLLY